MKKFAIALLFWFSITISNAQVELFSTQWAENNRTPPAALGGAAGAAAVSDNGGAIQAVPDVLTNLNGQANLKVIPAINVIGSYVYQHRFGSAAVGAGAVATHHDAIGVTVGGKLFSGFTQLDTATRINASNLWIAEASTFGINFGINVAYLGDRPGIKGLLLKTAFNYVNKSTPQRDSLGGFTDKFYIGAVHGKLGLEYSPIEVKDKVEFVIYVNYNFFRPTVEVDKFKEFFKADVETINFFDFGVRLPLKLIDKAEQNLTLFMDANFIVYSKGMKKIYDTNDTFIPVLKLGITQTFGL
jgi:hypothetical protein